MKFIGGKAHDLTPRSLGGFEAAYVEPKKPSIWRALWHRVLGFLLVLVLVAAILLVAADMYVRATSKGRTHASIEALPSGLPVLVFGTSPRVANGKDNSYFHGRITAAAELFKAGKASFIIVSGDNRQENYNEPKVMRRALILQGVPKDKIVCDFAGLRTLDSVVRVKEVFRQSQVIFVSQEFQNQRAVCLARHFEIDAHAYNAGGEATGAAWLYNWSRERLARVRMLLDLYLFDTAPKYLGPPVPVPDKPAEPAKP